MKGVILACVRELVKNKFGADKWQEIVEKTDFKGSAPFLAGANVEDKKFFKLLEGCSQVLGVSVDGVLDAFAAYWVNDFAPRTYSSFYSGCSTAKDFILKLDHIHEVITRSLADSSPPRYELEWLTDRDLVVTYKSKRGLIDLAAKLLTQVGVYFKTNLEVTHDGKTRITVRFPSA